MMKKLFYLIILILTLCFNDLYAQSTVPVKPQMVKVEAGTFTMGTSKVDDEDSTLNENERPAHKVKLSSFNICIHEVTVAEYRIFCIATHRAMPEAPTWSWNDKHPIVNVSFDDANAYCNWLGEQLNETYRLPTEAEWEFAAKGGYNSKGYQYSGSNDLDEVAWYEDNSGAQTNSVMRKKPNELGIYDMSGNVLEWCRDWYDEEYYKKSPLTNPKGPATGDYRVLRGGSFLSSASGCQVTSRDITPSDENEIAIPSEKYIGFRVVSSN